MNDTAQQIASKIIRTQPVFGRRTFQPVNHIHLVWIMGHEERPEYGDQHKQKDYVETDHQRTVRKILR